MRKWFVSLVLLALFFIPLGARAQESLTLNTLQIGIWPEYDKPTVLVIYSLTLPSTTALPATLSLRIPSNAGAPNGVAVRQQDGSLYNLDYTRQSSGDWTVITFSTTGPDVQLEYYDPSLTKEGDARHYQYLWPGDYAASQVTIQVQQPSGATDMVISPSLGAGSTANDGLIYYTQNIGAIPAGQDFTITIDYQKTSAALSAEGLPVGPSAPIPQGTASDLNVTSWLPWVLGILGAGLIIGGIIWFWQTGRQRPALQTDRRRRSSAARKADMLAGADETAIYCPQCGKRAAPGDQFCRSCGTQLKR